MGSTIGSRRGQRRCYTLPVVARQPRHVHPMRLTFDLLAIAACGGGGALLAWLIVSALGWTGVGGEAALGERRCAPARARPAQVTAPPTGEDSAGGRASDRDL